MTEDPSNPFGDAAAMPQSLASATARKRPGGLTAICVIAIILGALGLMSALMQAANLAGGRRMQEAFSGAGHFGSPPELREVQDEFNAAIQVINDKYLAGNVAIAVVHLAVASMLIFGGAMTLRFDHRGYRVLGIVCLVAIIFELARTVVYLMMQVDMLPVLQEYMPRIMEAAGSSGDRGAEVGAEIGSVMAGVSVVIGIVLACIWCLLKVIFYGITHRYLKKDPIRRLFVAESVETI